ncbi:MAG: 3-phosphoshikimate 1-carboxyvinyltransferase [Magnetococcales bacterium]|nr:3-phosphoshikimate 1-carboxyvinyltransferase [Magnetococcales bacterium]
MDRGCCNLRSSRGGPLRGTLTPPGDKSISHRALIFGSLAEGTTRIRHLLEGEDVLRTAAAFRAMGVSIESSAEGYTVQGVGLDGLHEPDDVLDLGNSGTGMRLLAGLLSSQPFLSVLTGDASLRSRPMARVIEPLSRMGARILARDRGRKAPLVIAGGELIPIDYLAPVASAQVKTALLLAGLNTAGETSVTEPIVTRDHTERLLAAFGATVEVTATDRGQKVTVDGWPTLRGIDLQVPGDFSAAAFPMVAALLVPESEVLLTDVGINPTRTGLLTLLRQMGADIEVVQEHRVGGEPVADLRVRHSHLRGVTVPAELVPLAIDEFPVFFTAAALARGETILTGASELRVKESDRIAAMADGLQRIGATVSELPDGIRIVGNPSGLNGNATVDSYTDHRIAMSLLVAGLVCREPVVVQRCDNIATSFPGFVAAMTGLGANLAS